MICVESGLLADLGLRPGVVSLKSEINNDMLHCHCVGKHAVQERTEAPEQRKREENLLVSTFRSASLLCCTLRC